MNAKELKELIEFLIERDISEFELERGDFKVRMKRGVAPMMAPAVAAPPVYAAPSYAPPVAAGMPSVASAAAGAVVPGAPAPPVAPASSSSGAETAEEVGLHVVRSPIVGTFYEAASPGAPPFIKIGDAVQSGQVLCIIEAMKLMNEIETEVAGTVIKRYVENAQPVEYGQPLFAIRAS